MKKSYLKTMALVACLLLGMSATAQQVRGDVTEDGTVDIADVNEVINIMLGKGGPTVTTYTVNGVSFKMVEVKGGTFTMGATEEQLSEASNNEMPAHQVTLSTFSIGQTEVTQELWLAVMGSNPSYFQPSNLFWLETNLQRPVECMTWDDCQTFISKLNELTGKSFRMPTEAEWEYAACGGKYSEGFKYAGSDNIDDVAWYSANSSTNTGPHSVGTKAPNELGLYDMSGYVGEYCQDWYGSYTNEAQTNPTGALSGTSRVYRGGGYYNDPAICRVSKRGLFEPIYASNNLGLRLAL